MIYFNILLRKIKPLLRKKNIQLFSKKISLKVNNFYHLEIKINLKFFIIILKLKIKKLFSAIVNKYKKIFLFYNCYFKSN